MLKTYKDIKWKIKKKFSPLLRNWIPQPMTNLEDFLFDAFRKTVLSMRCSGPGWLFVLSCHNSQYGRIMQSVSRSHNLFAFYWHWMGSARTVNRVLYIFRQANRNDDELEIANGNQVQKKIYSNEDTEFQAFKFKREKKIPNRYKLMFFMYLSLVNSQMNNFWMDFVLNVRAHRNLAIMNRQTTKRCWTSRSQI